MQIINNKCSNCGHDGAMGWLISSPVQCPQCRERDEEDEEDLQKNIIEVMKDVKELKDHSCCWEQNQPPACGIKTEHKICCLCGRNYKE